MSKKEPAMSMSNKEKIRQCLTVTAASKHAKFAPREIIDNLTKAGAKFRTVEILNPALAPDSLGTVLTVEAFTCVIDNGVA